MAAELGVDKIFGKGTTPGEVASYLAYALAPDVSAAVSGAGQSVSHRGSERDAHER